MGDIILVKSAGEMPRPSSEDAQRYWPKRNHFAFGSHGDRYKIIGQDEIEKPLSSFERFGRGFLGVLYIIVTLGRAYFNGAASKYFVNPKKTVLYAMKTEETAWAFREGKLIYISPNLISSRGGKMGGQECNFALINAENSQRFVPVMATENPDEYVPFTGNPLELLLKLAQNTDPLLDEAGIDSGSPISFITQHGADKPFTEDQILDYFLKDLDTLSTLNQKSLTDVLRLAQAKGRVLNPEWTQYLFLTRVGRGNAELTRLILELDPAVIHKIKDPLYMLTSMVLERKDSDPEKQLLLAAIRQSNL